MTGIIILFPSQAEFIQVGTAYSVLKDDASRRAYDRELKSNSWRPQRPSSQRPTTTSSNTNTAEQQQAAKDKEFNSFMDMFDETVSGMSDAELNMAMGAAAVVGSIVGSIIGARAAKGNSILSSAASMVGSAMASQAASTLVQTVHEDSKQRVLEREDRAERIARGEPVQEPTQKDNRERLFKDAGAAFQKVAGAAVGGGGGGRRSMNSFAGNNSTTNDQGGGINWKQAARMACMAAEVCAELGSKSQRR